MNYVDKGAAIVLPVVGCLVALLVWLFCARAVLTEQGRYECRSPILASAVFFAPFIAGLCWLVGWLVA